tara:strand:- start:4331 stop:4531 length:201 start_codon:yes stop_codon:yes gene_type:complete
MSGEQISIERDIKEKGTDKNMKKRNVDINVLLNRVRADQKKEKLENIVFISLISVFIIITGVIISL